MGNWINTLTFYTLLLLSLIEGLLIITYAILFVLYLQEKNKLSEMVFSKYYNGFIMSIVEVILCSFFLIMASIFGAFALYFKNANRLLWFIISSFIHFLTIWGILAIGFILDFWPSLQSGDSDSIQVLNLLNMISNIFNMIKSLFYLVASILVCVQRSPSNNNNSSFGVHHINENLTPELYNSFLDICKHPNDNQLKQEFEKLIQEKRKLSFDKEKKTDHHIKDKSNNNHSEIQRSLTDQMNINYVLTNKSY